MIKVILKAIFSVLVKIGLAAVTEKFLAKLIFDGMYWLASLTTNTVDDKRVKLLEDIYYNRHTEVDDARTNSKSNN